MIVLSLSKVAQGVASLAVKHNKPIIAICGAVDASPSEWQSVEVVWI